MFGGWAVAGESRRDLIYRMRVDTEQAKKEFAATTGTVRGFATHLRKLEEQQRRVDEAMTAMGRGMVIAGTAIGVGLGLAAKAAIDWESAWTGVVKVVDGSPEQLAALEMELRNMATTLPQSQAEIAGVAAAAGQLGVATEDVAGFTRVMVDLGVATNLTSEDAAFALSRLMNIMQTAPDNVSNLGSAIVGLGNNSATTEAEITEMALRIAGAGQTIGLSEADVLGFSAALSSVGVEAEAGGTAISTAFKLIDNAVREGGEGLETFAQVAGVTADEFAAKFRSAPAEAITLFVEGLGRMNENGQNVNATLNDLGLGGIRLSDSMLRLAGAGDLLNRTLEIGNAEWDENSALLEEASRRYGTTEAQIQIAKNQLTEMGIQLGEHLLPAINDFLRAGRGFFAWFNDLDDSVKEAIVQLGLAATAIGLVGGAALIAAPKLNAMSIALAGMGRAGAGKALKGVARVISGPWGVAIALATTILGKFIGEQAEAKGRVEDFKATLDEQTSAFTDQTRVLAANQLQQKELVETAKDLGIQIGTLTDAVTGDPEAMEQVNDAIARRREELVDLAGEASSNLTAIDKERGALTDLATGLEDVSGELETAQQEHRETAETAALQAAAANDASAAEEAFAESLGISTAAAQEATGALDDLDQQVRELIDSAFALSGAQRDVEAGIDELTETLAENGATLDINTEAGRENEAAIEDMISVVADLAVTTAQQTGSTEEANKVLAEERERLEDVLQAAGFTADEIEDYIGVLDGVPGEIDTVIETSGLGTAIRQVEVLDARLDAIDRTVRISFETQGFVPRGGGSIPVAADGGYFGFASGGLAAFPHGGFVRGPGGPRSDSILARISNGEFVVNAAATSQNRQLLEAINSGRSIGAAMAGAQTVNNFYEVNVRGFSNDFNLGQIEQDLQYRGLF